MATRNTPTTFTLEEWRVEFNELATDIGNVSASSQGDQLTTSATDIVGAINELETNFNALSASSSAAADNITTGDAAVSIATSSGDITLDTPTDIILDADGGDVFFKNGGTTYGSMTDYGSGDLVIYSGTTQALRFGGANVIASGTYTGGGLMTTGGNIVIPDAGNIGSGTDTDAISIAGSGVVAITATTASSSATTGALTVGGGAGVAADLSVGDDVKLLSDDAVLSFGADSDVTLTHVADTGILLNSTMAIQFNDASQYINAPSNAILDINATDEIELNATLTDINANLDVSGTYTGGGTMTTGGNIVIPDAGNIGSVSDTDAIAIASDGVVTFSQNPVRTGPRYNMLINGDMSVFARNASVTITSATTVANDDDTFTLDRWILLSDTNDVVDVSQPTGAGYDGSRYAIGLDVETVNKKFGIVQIMEYRNCYPGIGGTVSLSFKAKVSSTTKLDNVKAGVIAWTGSADTAITSDVVSAWNAEDTDPTLATNLTFENTPANLSVTTSWATYKIENISVDTSSTGNLLVFIWSDVTDTTAGDFLYITDVQLEVGVVANAFDRQNYTQTELDCQRYYGEMTLAMPTYGTQGVLGPRWPTTMRSAPTLTWAYAGTAGTADRVYRLTDANTVNLSSGNVMAIDKNGLREWYNTTAEYSTWASASGDDDGIVTHLRFDAEM